MTGIRTLGAALALLITAGTAQAGAMVAIETGEKPADPLGVAEYQRYKPTPLPAEAAAALLPTSKGPMSKPGSLFPGSPDLMPPLSLPTNPTVVPGATLPANPAALPPLPTGAQMQGMPLQLPGAPSATPEVKPERPKLQATFAGRSPSASVAGRTILPGQNMPKSDLKLRSVGRGSVTLSDGSEVWIGDEIPEKSEKKEKTNKTGADETPVGRKGA